MAKQYKLTSVGVNPARDRAYRMRMYFLTMTLRMVCIISLFWVRGPWIILVAIGAIVLPYFAVLIANAVSHVGGTAPDAPTPLELEAPAIVTESDESAAPPSQTIIVIDAPADRRSHGNEDAD